MPSKSKKQRKFMAAAAHNPKFAASAGIDPSVAREFNAADVAAKRIKKRKPVNTPVGIVRVGRERR